MMMMMMMMRRRRRRKWRKGDYGVVGVRKFEGSAYFDEEK